MLLDERNATNRGCSIMILYLDITQQMIAERKIAVLSIRFFSWLDVHGRWWTSILHFTADEDGEMDVNEVFILYKGEAMPYAIYKALNTHRRGDNSVNEYARFVGKLCATRMLLYLG